MPLLAPGEPQLPQLKITVLKLFEKVVISWKNKYMSIKSHWLRLFLYSAHNLVYYNPQVNILAVKNPRLKGLKDQ